MDYFHRVWNVRWILHDYSERSFEARVSKLGQELVEQERRNPTCGRKLTGKLRQASHFLHQLHYVHSGRHTFIPESVAAFHVPFWN